MLETVHFRILVPFRLRIRFLVPFRFDVRGVVCIRIHIFFVFVFVVVVGLDSIPFGSIQFGYNSVRFHSVRFHSVRFDSFGSHRHLALLGFPKPAWSSLCFSSCPLVFLTFLLSFRKICCLYTYVCFFSLLFLLFDILCS